MNLIDLLQEGERNSLSRQHLSIQLGVSDRALRRQVQQLRLRGIPVISHSDSQGYYIAENDADIRSFLYETKHRIQELQAVYDAIGGLNEI